MIREFHAFAEEFGDSGHAAGKIEKELKGACNIHAKWREGKISKKQRSSYLMHSRKRLDDLFTDGITFGNDKLAELCMRLADQYDHLWAFAKIEGMEPTNNMAERDLRKIVLWRKKSFGTRSLRGQRFVERITSVVETIKKNGKNVLRFLEEAIKAFCGKQPPPYIAIEVGV